MRGTPLQNSINIMDSIRATGKFERRPRASKNLSPFQDALRENLSSERVAVLKDATKSFGTELVGWTLALLKGVVEGGVAFFNLLALVFITPLVTFYLLRDWDVIIAKIDQCLPRDYADTVREVISDIDKRYTL